MPTNSLPFSKNDPYFNLKKISLALLLLLSPVVFMGQTLTGLWTGALSNDSNTVRKEQSFEIALTEYRGKVFGYSRSEFIVDDTLYYVVKRVKGVIDGDICEVVDDDIIAYNFRGKLDKGVKVTSTFRRNQSDSTWYLDGSWKTNATKKYYTVSGKVNLAEEKDLTASKIFPHLEELKLAEEVAFYKDRKEGTPVVKVVKPEKRESNYATPINRDVALNPSKPNLEAAIVNSTPEEDLIAVKKNDVGLPKTNTKPVEPGAVAINPAAPDISVTEAKVPEQPLIAVKKPGAENEKTATKEITTDPTGLKPAEVKRTVAANTKPVTTSTDTAANNTSSNTIAVANVEEEEVSLAEQAIAKRKQQESIAANKPTQVNNAVNKNNSNPSTAAIAQKPIEQKENKPETVKTPEKPIAEITAKTAQVAGRKSEFSQVVSFKSDSLELALYDNGEIDGDTVSIYLDGEVIMAKQGLKSSAIRKTIYVKPGHEDFTLVLFADNLGKYPPNTGLLVVRDGDDVYNLRFSSDFQKNAGIVFRRKR